MVKLLIYLPALNEEEKLAKVLNSLPKKISGLDSVDVLVVDDGSTDATPDIAISCNVKLISHRENKGLSRVFETALNYALDYNYDLMVSIDADGQFNSNQICDLIAPILEGNCDFTTGNRFKLGKPKNMSSLKFWGNKQISKIVSFVGGQKIRDVSCGFRAYSKNCLRSINLHGKYTYTHETILDLLDKNYKIKEIDIDVTYFDGRVSRVANNIFKYAFKTFTIIIKCLKDYQPFSFFSFISFVIFSLGVIIGSFVVLHWIKTGAITPYKSIGFLALAIELVAFLVFVLALIADMLTRIRKNQEKILFCFLVRVAFNFQLFQFLQF